MKEDSDFSTDQQAPDKTASAEEQSRLEFELALEEHRLANAQILFFQEANYKNYEFIIVAIGAAIVAGSFIVEQKAYSLLLILSLPFHILTWLQARRAIVSNHLANYILFVSAPRLRKIVQQARQQPKPDHVFNFTFWEEYVAQISRGNRKIKITVGMSEAGRAVFQLSVAVALVVAYFLLRASDPQYISSAIDAGLIVLNGVAVIASIYSYVVAATFFGPSAGEES